MISLLESQQEQLVSYSYSYPHKSSYRRLDPPIPLADVWREENKQQLALYVHVPFCEMRCGFCNLFTQSQPELDLVESYLSSLERQTRVVSQSVDDYSIELFAMGGGTPTHLSAAALDKLLSTVQSRFNFDLQQNYSNVETSPATATREHLEMLRNHGVRRISIGVQSFVEADNRWIGRPQQQANVDNALDRIKQLKFHLLNIDLIYGGEEQSLRNWEESVARTLEYDPEEVYLYPLYVRPETGLARVRSQAKHRTDLYEFACEQLLLNGFQQMSLRCFRSKKVVDFEEKYACQRDGMIGLGCGARSYTKQLHYGTHFATTQAGIQAILRDWINQTDDNFGLATHGISLSTEEQKRRFVILNLLQLSGLNMDEYHHEFGSDPWQDLPALDDLAHRGWLTQDDHQLQLTLSGIAASDVVGPMLYSPSVQAALRKFTQQ